MKYKPTIGLEIHAELRTKTKMFCDSKNDTSEKRSNVNICPICLGHPGTLPSINKEAVKSILKVGIALGGKIADFTEFDRKNYFYPDIPKGYQISQYKYPLVSGGNLLGFSITRVHLEEDTAKSTHNEGGYSLIDFNRAGVPLMELVTEPVIHSAEDASSFAKELQLLLQYLKVSDANMEKGEMRVEANISVSKNDTLGTKVEVKNLNSFKSVQKAIDFEIKRHMEILEGGGKIIQETRGFDETTEETFSQREKEESHDYRYFPDPDLPKLYISKIAEFKEESLLKDITELPWQKRQRFKADYGLKNEDIEIFIRSPRLSSYFENVCGGIREEKFFSLASNYLLSDVMGISKSKSISMEDVLSKISHSDFRELVKLISEGSVSSRGAKDVLKIMFEEGGGPEKIAQERGLMQKSDEDEIKIIANKVIEANDKVVSEYKSGKEASLQFLIGQIMKESGGSANPQVAKNILLSLLK